MTDLKWTDKQQEVIDARKQNILVSAAAGSGKTAVLVERIVNLVTDKNHPIDVDNLLVVTFTKAAAGEMKERVLALLLEKQKENPMDVHINKQLNYVHNASICTIDSFCSQIFRDYFDKLDVDPGMTITDSAELQMVQADVLQELKEEKYVNGDKEFLFLCEKYCTPKSEKKLDDMILQLHNEADSNPDPEGWLIKCRQSYEDLNEKSLRQLHIYTRFKEKLSETVRIVIEMLNQTIELLEDIDVTSRKKTMEPKAIICRELLTEMMKAQNFIDSGEEKEAIAVLKELKPTKFRSIKDTECNEYRAIVTFSDVVDIVKDIKEKNVLFWNLPDTEEELKDIRETASALVNITLEFMKKYREKKKELSIMDFSDVEHYAHSILLEKHDDGNFYPTEVAKEISKQYAEIMIDEYQDSNRIQEDILTAVSKGNGYNNVFMVGDVKQSIYRFRQADPSLFNEKYDTYDFDKTSDFRKIVLDKNFRSRKEILDSVNFIFSKIMHKEVGGIEYDENHSLTLGADYPPLPEGQNNNTEFMIVDGKAADEARAVALKIKYLTESGEFKIYRDGEYVTPQYRDIVILLKSVKGDGDVFVKEMEKLGIPGYYESGSGFYSAKEVNTVVEYLKIIDNPYQDVSLVTVLKSPMYNFTSNELALIRAADKKYSYYDAMRMYTYDPDAKETLIQKIEAFFEDLDYYRNIVSYTKVYDLICLILKKQKYEEYVLAMPGGQRRSKNLEILKEKAISYDEGVYSGLFNFVRYIDKIKESEHDEGEALSVNENDNIVRVMTMHKSKGLQFPIVFVSMLGKSLSASKVKSLEISREKGFGFDYINSTLNIQSETWQRLEIKLDNSRENLAECLRVLYVAMTRAKEKMYLTCTDNSFRSKDGKTGVNKWVAVLKEGSHAFIPDESATSADLIGLSLITNPVMSQLLDSYAGYTYDSLEERAAFECSVYSNEEFEDNEKFNEYITVMPEQESVITSEDSLVSEEFYRRMDTDVVYDAQVYDRLRKVLDWKYIFENEYNYPAKLTVSEVKRRFADKFNEEEDGDSTFVYRSELSGNIPDPGRKIKLKSGKTMVTDTMQQQKKTETIPKFILGKENKLTGSSLGTAYHKLFEVFDYKIEPEIKAIGTMKKKLLADGIIDETTYNSVDDDKLLAFTETNLYGRMKAAFDNNTLYRERAFLLGINSKDLEYDNLKNAIGRQDLSDPANVNMNDTDKVVLVQGVIDACFVENGEYVIVDYKTDNVSDPQELVDKYRVQLLCYARAIQQITGIRVSELIIYSVKFGQELKVGV